MDLHFLIICGNLKKMLWLLGYMVCYKYYKEWDLEAAWFYGISVENGGAESDYVFNLFWD